MSNLFKYTKRVLTSVLAAAVVLTAIPSTAFGAEIIEEDNEAIDSIYKALSSNVYVTDDMEFLEVLGKNVSIKDYDAINDLIETYFNLKSII